MHDSMTACLINVEHVQAPSCVEGTSGRFVPRVGALKGYKGSFVPSVALGTMGDQKERSDAFWKGHYLNGTRCALQTLQTLVDHLVDPDPWRTS